MDLKKALSVLAGGVVALSASAAFGQAEAARAYEAELLADAANRTSNAAAGAGWEKGKFYIGDGGANTLNLGGFIEFRYNMNFRDEDSAGDQGDFTHGFGFRRTQLQASGSIWDKNFTYVIMGEFSGSSGSFTLRDAYAGYKWDNGFNVRFGQYKTNLVREENVSDKLQLTAERSVVNAVFSQSRSQGVGIGYADKQFRVFADFTDGINTLNTDFTSDNEADYALTLRGEMLISGEDFKRFDDNTSWRSSEDEFAMLIGAGLHWQDGGETGGTVEEELFQVTADASFEGKGWNAFIAGIWRNSDDGGTDRDDFGVVAQGGFFVTDQAELFARYDVVVPDDEGDEDPFNTITAGANYYVSPESHAVKLTAEVIYYVDAEGEVPIIPASSNLNLLPDTEEGQFGIILEAQVLF